MPAPGEHHPAFEEYCECIFELDEDDVDVIQARIAERLQVSRPAVSEMIRKLEAEGLVTHDGAALALTEAGERARPAGRAPAPARRALPHRHPPAVVGGSAPRGRQVGARDQQERRGGDQPPARRADHLPARQPDPRVELRRHRRQPALPADRRRAVHRATHPGGAGVHARAARVPRGVVVAPGLLGRRSPPPRPTARSRSRSTVATWGLARSRASGSWSRRDRAARRRQRPWQPCSRWGRAAPPTSTPARPSRRRVTSPRRRCRRSRPTRHCPALLGDIETLMRHLDEQIVDEDHVPQTMRASTSCGTSPSSRSAIATRTICSRSSRRSTSPTAAPTGSGRPTPARATRC